MIEKDLKFFNISLNRLKNSNLEWYNSSFYQNIILKYININLKFLWNFFF
jgi:hypothetical protein